MSKDHIVIGNSIRQLFRKIQCNQESLLYRRTWVKKWNSHSSTSDKMHTELNRIKYPNLNWGEIKELMMSSSWESVKQMENYRQVSTQEWVLGWKDLFGHYSERRCVLGACFWAYVMYMCHVCHWRRAWNSVFTKMLLYGQKNVGET